MELHSWKYLEDERNRYKLDLQSMSVLSNAVQAVEASTEVKDLSLLTGHQINQGLLMKLTSMKQSRGS